MWEELIHLVPTVAAVWSLLAVTAVGVAVLPWADDDLVAASRAYRSLWAALAGLASAS